MDIITIFGSDNLEENGGLLSIKYDDENLDEYNRLFELWSDSMYLQEYLITNSFFLKTDFFKHKSIDSIRLQIEKELNYLEDFFINTYENGFDRNRETLLTIFKPLNDNEYNILPLQEQKATAIIRNIKNPILRLYAIHIHENLFIITGGAIKLVHKMKDHPDTILEEKKIKVVRQFLKEKDITTADDINYYYGNFE